MSAATQRMGFLEARKLTERVAGSPLAFTLAASGQVDPLILYIRAHAALAGYDALVTVLPFGTLGQHLRQPPGDAAEVILLLPWDFVAALDWRSGVPALAPEIDDCIAESQEVAQYVNERRGARLFYLPAATPPLYPDPERDRELNRILTALALELGAELLPPESFALAPYLASGCPIAGAALEETGAVLAAGAVGFAAVPPEPAKLLVTDLDNVMWHGVIAEDGLDAIAYGPEGQGWRHFLYQSLVKRLRGEGVLVAAVTRNRPEDARAPFRAGDTLLAEEDFVTFIASYQAKSAQIAALAKQLNLGLDAVVFVDDNPIELAEIERELPEVRRLCFPAEEGAMPGFMAELAQRFARRIITEEDRRRTELYRQRLETMAPQEATGADLTQFLQGLEMRMLVRDRGKGDRRRAVQLINKTNQFNLNGRRWDDAAVAAVIESGGRLFTGELADRSGSHGEVLALLVDRDGMVESFVMSCRIFLRHAEHAFLMALIEAGVHLAALRYVATDRNEPFRSFIVDPSFSPGPTGLVAFDVGSFVANHRGEAALIATSWEKA